MEQLAGQVQIEDVWWAKAKYSSGSDYGVVIDTVSPLRTLSKRAQSGLRRECRAVACGGSKAQHLLGLVWPAMIPALQD